MAFLHLDRLYILAGEGQVLRVFDHAENKLIGSYGIFNSEAIHGIVCHGVSCSNEAPRSTAILLLWGGRSISILNVGITLDLTHKVHVEAVVHEQFCTDWVMDGCFYAYHHIPDESIDESTSPDFFLVNAHNEVISLRLPRKSRGETELARNPIAAGPRSMLYSAHIITTGAGRVLIAAGTFSGEIIFWSFRPGNSGVALSSTHNIFRGHQGSIFGLQISEAAGDGPVQRVLASCSDDRTIRIWDVSDTTSQLSPKQLQPSSESGFGASDADSVKCLATAMAHTSRIWGLRFLRHKDDSWGLLSYGEDAIAQARILCPEPIGKVSSLEATRLRFELRHQTTYRYHSGKSIWAAAVHDESTYSCLISTGGADGRITSYRPRLKDLDLRSQASFYQNTIEEACGRQAADSQLSNGSDGHVSKKQPQAPAGHLFNALGGDWKISRTISDGIYSDLAGGFEGTATFTPREPSDDSYDAEYLYSEIGDFTTPQGLKLKANRQYVWRYHDSSDSVTVWFVKTDGSQTVDYLFHTLSFHKPESENREHFQQALPFDVTASGHHSCEKDDYQVDHTFRMKSISVIDQWTAKFTVRGPRKNYIAVSNYTRNGQLCEESESNEARAEVVSPPILPTGREGDWKLQRGDGFKTYAWLSETDFLASTEHGYILIGTVNYRGRTGQTAMPGISWETIHCKTSLRPSCIATSVPSMGIVLLTGSEGTIYLYQHSIKRVLAIHQLPGKLAYLRAQDLRLSWADASRADPSTFHTALGSQENGWRHLKDRTTAVLEVGLVAKCLGSSEINVMFLRYSSEWSYSINELQYEFKDTFIVTSSCFVKIQIQLLILGSRRGELAVYDLSESLQRPRRGHTVRLHGDAITSIVVVANEFQACEVGKIFFATTGRDGTYKIHSLNVNQVEQRDDGGVIEIETVNDCKLPFGPYIEGAYFDFLTQHLFIWGFRSTQFIVWNESRKAEVLSVECGNAHRNWDYVAHKDGKGGGSFVFTKASLCCIYFQEQASHRVLQCGSHGREVKALALSPPSQDRGDLRSRFLVTGAEDTAIRIFGHGPANENPRLHCLRILTDHTTGIQQLRWSADGRRLFSAAGCEEFLVWRITPIHFIGLGVVREARCPTVTEPPDLRIMDFDVLTKPVAPGTTSDPRANAYLLTMAYSDSSMRVYYYSSWLEHKFHLVFTGSYTTHCLTQIRDLRPTFQGDLHLCTTSTDGSLAFWQLDTRDLPKSATPVPPQSPLWSLLHKGHQSSVKCLEIFPLSSSESIVVTGGDDGDVWLTHLNFSNSEGSYPTSAVIKLSPAHAAAVTSVACLGTADMGKSGMLLLASVSTDQRLKVWIVAIDKGAGLEGVRLANASDVYTNVADPSSLGHFQDEEGRLWLYVAGVGIEIWRVKLEVPPIRDSFRVH